MGRLASRIAQAVSQREGLLKVGVAVWLWPQVMLHKNRAATCSKVYIGVAWFGFVLRIIVFWEKNWAKSTDFGGRGKGKNLSWGWRKGGDGSEVLEYGSSKYSEQFSKKWELLQ